MRKLFYILFLFVLVVPTLAQEATPEVETAEPVTISFSAINFMAETRGFHLGGKPEGEEFITCFVQHSENESGVNCFEDEHWNVLEVIDNPHSYTITESDYWEMMVFLSEQDETITTVLRPYFRADGDCTDSEVSRGCAYTTLTIPSPEAPYCVGKLNENLVSESLPNRQPYFILEPLLTAEVLFTVGEGDIVAHTGDYLEIIPINGTEYGIGVIRYVPAPTNANRRYRTRGEQFVISLDLVEMIHCPPNAPSAELAATE